MWRSYHEKALDLARSFLGLPLGMCNPELIYVGDAKLSETRNQFRRVDQRSTRINLALVFAPSVVCNVRVQKGNRTETFAHRVNFTRIGHAQKSIEPSDPFDLNRVSIINR